MMFSLELLRNSYNSKSSSILSERSKISKTLIESTFKLVAN